MLGIEAYFVILSYTGSLQAEIVVLFGREMDIPFWLLPPWLEAPSR